MIQQACRQLVRLGTIALLGLLLAGCLVRTETFLSDRADSPADEQLLGAWTVMPENPDDSSLFIRRSDDGGVDVLLVELSGSRTDARRRAKWEEASLWTTEIDGRGYLNMKSDDGNYILAYVVRDDGALEFGFMKPKPFIAAVRDGVLKGEVHNGILTTVSLTDTSDKITAFIRANGGHGLFEFADGERENGEGARIALVRRNSVR